MTFQQLLYVSEISKCGSINKAAHKLFLSQSGISTAVKDLEEELGIRFFERSNRGVEFTPEGREFLSYAVSLLQQKQRIETLYGDNRGAAAPVQLCISTQRYPFTEAAFLKYIYHAEENQFRYSIKETSMDMVIDDVYDHRADIGVIFITELTEKIIRRLMDNREIEFHELAAVAPCVYLRRDHPLSAYSGLTEDDLAGYPYVSFEHDQGVAVDFAEEYQMLSFKKPARCIKVNNRATAMNVLASTDAITTGSGLMAPELSDPRVISIPLEGANPIHLGWIHPKYSKLSQQAELFIPFLKQSVSDSVQYTKEVHQQRQQELES